jgi:hypothetical protein
MDCAHASKMARNHTSPRRDALGTLVLVLFALAPSMIPAATLSGSFQPLSLGTSVDLTDEGTLDWAEWGLVTEYSFNHKYGVTQQITYSVVTDPYLTDGPYLLASGPVALCWTNGNPVHTANTTNGTSIFGDKLSGNSGTGFKIYCLADNGPRRLKVYVGTSGAQATFTASLGGVSSYSDGSLNGASGLVNGVYTLDFQAAYPGQTLTVSFSSTDPSGYIILKAATLAGTNAPPTVAITSPRDGAVLSAPATFSVTTAAAGVDSVVTNLILLRNGMPLAQSATCALSVALTNQPAGAYNFCAVAMDACGMCVTSFPSAVYVLKDGGVLNGSVGSPPASLDLTAEGSSDWAHWGLTSPGSFDHKAGVPSCIPNVTLLNASAADLATYADNRTAYSWSDGTPIAHASGSPTGIFLYTGNSPAAGFQLTVPAGNSLRRLNVYVGLYAAQGRFDAWLSDYSALPYCDSSLSQAYGNAYAMYTLYYASPTPGASLVLSWTPAQIFDSSFGNLTWQAATLWQQPPRPWLRVVSSPSGSNPFALSFYSQKGLTYTVQYLNPQTSKDWQMLTNFPGEGCDTVVTDPDAGPCQRFYRVMAQ